MIVVRYDLNGFDRSITLSLFPQTNECILNDLLCSFEVLHIFLGKASQPFKIALKSNSKEASSSIRILFILSFAQGIFSFNLQTYMNFL